MQQFTRCWQASTLTLEDSRRGEKALKEAERLDPQHETVKLVRKLCQQREKAAKLSMMERRTFSPYPSQHHRVSSRLVPGPLAREGHALAEVTTIDELDQPRAQTYLVPAGLPGEDVTFAVETFARKAPKRRRRHWKARPPRVWITEIYQPSPLRVQAACPVFGECGGCQLQHMHYAAQLAWKRDIVGQLLRDTGAFDDPPLLDTVPCAVPWNYRNHMRFSVNRDGQPGLTARERSACCRSRIAPSRTSTSIAPCAC